MPTNYIPCVRKYRLCYRGVEGRRGPVLSRTGWLKVSEDFTKVGMFGLGP